MICQSENRRTATRMIAFQAILLPAMLAACVSALRAVEPGKPSRTAMLVLQMRPSGRSCPTRTCATRTRWRDVSSARANAGCSPK